MLCFFVVQKLLMLKLLLASISGLNAYDFGYHASAEEYDNFMRETKRTWTRDLLANEHRRAWTLKPPYRNLAGYFVPKYNEDNVRRAYSAPHTTAAWPGHVQRVGRPQTDNRADKPSSALNGNAIGSSLDFNLIGMQEQNMGVGVDVGMGEWDESVLPEITLNDLQQTHAAQSNASNQSTFSRPLLQPVQPSANSTKVSSIKQTLNSVIGITSASKTPTSAHQSFANLNPPFRYSEFPIFFSNPATGIIYAITEVGHVPTSATTDSASSNGSIPIFISKEQYEHDLNLQRRYYENRCSIALVAGSHKRENATAHSGASHTVTHPQIIRLQRPTAPTYSKPTSSKFPNHPHKPPPVLVQTELTIRDQAHFPTRRHKPKIKRKNKKKPNRPGRKRLPANATQSIWPQIIRGVRVSTVKPQTSTETQQPLATQLEKPNPGNTDFKLSAAKNDTSLEEHHVRRRSVTNIRAYIERVPNITRVDAYTQLQLAQSLLSERQEIGSKNRSLGMATSRHRVRRRYMKLGNHTKAHTLNISAAKGPTRVNPPRPKPEIFSLNTNSTRRPKTRKDRPKLGNQMEEHTLSSSALNRTNLSMPKSFKQRTNTTTVKNTHHIKLSKGNGKLSYNSTTVSPNIARKIPVRHKRRKHKAKVDNHGELDIFDFYVDEEYDDDDEGGEQEKETTNRNKHKNKDAESDNDNDDDGDEYEDDDDDDDDDSYIDDEESDVDDDEPTNKLLKQRKHKHQKESKKSEESETAQDYTEESIEQTTNVNKNSIIDENGSSAEPSTDYGAMSSTEYVLVTPPTTKTTTTKEPKTTTKKPKSSKTKYTSKKRIRRRPSSTSDSSTSYEDYDDDSDDDSTGSGIGGFFRMIFYPMQVFMNGVVDNIVSKESEEEQYSYPTYTTYHNGIQAIERGDDEYDAEEEEQSNSLTTWLSSLFGFNRRTKNIGSTTPYPAESPPPSQSSTEPPSWFESLFGFGAKSTTASSILEDSNEQDDKWFFGWFDRRPKRRRRKTTTTSTTVRTPAAQVPILTIVDPLKNPQNWIGILAHHIINATATSVTQNPIINAIAAQATTNPEVPRKITYDRYQIWRLKPIDDMQVYALEEYKKSDDGIKLQWLKGPSLRGLTDVLVPPKQLLDFEASLSFESIAHEVLIYDVGKTIAYEQAQEQFYLNAAMRPHKNHKQQHKQQQALTMSWHKYYEYDDIITHLEMLRMRHPQLIELIHIGRSYEGRPLVVVKIESKENAASIAAAGQMQLTQKKLKNKRKTKEANSVFIESGTHGLEWIGPATSLWMISELLRLIKSNKTTIDNEYIKNTTWYFMPILNPDGYVYSHKYDRFWRKTRSRHIARRTGIIDSAMTWLQQKKAGTRVCYGVDLDHNWHYQWGKRGSSRSPCNELYAGPGPFSEPESKALSEFLIDYRKQIKLYISLQAYGQIISYPMKANTSFNAERIDDFLDVAMVGTDGLRKQGSKSRYKIDSTNDLVENRSGCSDAFAAYEVGIPFSFTIQLADIGVHGYLLPSASIEPTARDTFEIITAMVDYI